MHYHRPLALPKALPHHQPVITQHAHLSTQQSKHQCYRELDSALNQLGGGKFQLLLLSCICLVWAGDAAEVMVLSYLGPAVSERRPALLGSTASFCINLVFNLL
jgi:hypothetical protein